MTTVAAMKGVLGWVVRWRVAILAVTLVVSAGFEIWRQSSVVDLPWFVDLVVRLVLPFGLILWMISINRSHHPAVLLTRPTVPALEVPPNPGMIIGAAGYTVLGARTIGMAIRDLNAGTDLVFSVIYLAFFLLALVMFWASALGRAGIRLYPEGIVNRQLLGSVFIPWDSLGGPVPAFAYRPDRVTLKLDGPVRKQGFALGDPTVLSALGVSAELLARAIHEYANRPDLRPHIGTEEETERFHAIPQIAELTTR